MSAQRPLLALLTVALMLATLVPAQAQWVPVSSAQNAVIQSPPPAGLGPGAPWGQWTSLTETTTFYLHATGTAGTQPDGCNAPTGNNYMDLLRPTGATGHCDQVGVYQVDDDGTGHFPGSTWDSMVGGITEPLTTLNVTNIFSFKVTAFIQGAHGNNLVRARVYELDPSTTPATILSNHDTAPGATTAQPIATFVLRPVAQTPVDTSGNTPAGTQGTIPFYGEFTDLGVYGYSVNEGNSLRLELVMVGEQCGALGLDVDVLFPDNIDGSAWCPGEPAVIHYDRTRYPSQMQILSDSARVNVWTDNVQLQHVNAFPQGSRGTVPDRQVSMRALVANTWGNREGAGCTGTGIAPDLDANTCPYDNLDENKIRLRVRDVTTSHTTSNGFCQTGGSTTGTGYSADSPNHLCYLRLVGVDQGYGLTGTDVGIRDSYLGCCNSASTQRLILYSASPQMLANGMGLFQYTFRYNDTFPAGNYRIEFQDSVDGWNAYHTFSVGSGGFSFRFAPFEQMVSSNGSQAHHTVGLDQRTDYVLRVTNNGADVDTFGFSVPTPGAGWTGAVQPSFITLNPGASGDVTLHVTPKTGGKSGDVRVVTVQAVSMNDNSVKTLYTLTTLTAVNVHGVDITTDKQLILTRPLVTTAFPVFVRNLGTREDQFAVTASGYPEGWQVSLTPVLMDIFAASYQNAIVILKAPAEAIPDSSFTLDITSRDTLGLSDPDTVSIPVKVTTVAGLVIDVLGHEMQNCASSGQTSFRCAQIDTRDIADALRHSGVASGGSPTAVCPVPGVGGLTIGCQLVMQDTRFDNGPIYRVKFENTGDKQDTIQLTGAWMPGLGDNPNCDGMDNLGNDQYDGVPDGWRFNLVRDAVTDPLNRLDISMSNVLPGGTAKQRGTAADGMRESASPGIDGGAFSGEMPLALLTLPAHTTQYLYFEMYWTDTDLSGLDNDGAGTSNCRQRASFTSYRPTDTWSVRDNLPDGPAVFRLSYRSQEDPTIRGRVGFKADFTGQAGSSFSPPGCTRNQAMQQNGIAPCSVYGARIEMGLDRTTGLIDQTENLVPIGGGKVYNLIVTNTGNSVDDLKVKLRSPANGWTHRFVLNTAVPDVGEIVNSQYINNPTTPAALSRTQAGTDRTAPPAKCRLDPNDQPNPVDSTIIRCRNMGVYDAALIQVEIRPPVVDDPNGKFDAAKVGDGDLSTVSVTSERAIVENNPLVSGGDVTLKTIVQGEYAFKLHAHPPSTAQPPLFAAATKDVLPGRSVAFPFSIQNIGTSADLYDISVVVGECQTGRPCWMPQLQSVNTVHVPAGLTYHGFLQVTAPPLPNVTVGDVENFRIRVRSLAPEALGHAQQIEQMDFFAKVVEGKGCELSTTTVTIPPFSQDRIEVKATCSGGRFNSVQFRVNPAELPAGWRFVCLDARHPNYDALCNTTTPNTATNIIDTRQLAGGGEGKGDFAVSVPANELAQSRVVFKIQACFDNDPEECRYVDAVVNIKSIYGIDLKVLDPLHPENKNPEVRIFPPGNVNALGTGVPIEIVNYTLSLTNSGLTPMTVVLTNTPPPCTDALDSGKCWRLYFDPVTVILQPGETKSDIGAFVEVPADAPAGFRGVFQVCATVAEDQTEVSCIELRPEVGRYGVAVAQPKPAFLAPQETADFLFVVSNTGTVDDWFTVNASLALPGLAGEVTWDRAKSGLGGPGECDAPYDATTKQGNYFALRNKFGCEVFIPAGGSRAVRMHMRMPASLTTPPPSASGQAQPSVPIVLLARSRLSTTNLIQASANAAVHILDYASADIDFDGLPEYAIDRDREVAGTNGYEEFRENIVKGGTETRQVMMCQFLDDAVRDSKCAGNATYFIDGDGNKLAEFFVSTNGGTLPNVYWRPDRICPVQFQNLTVAKDVTGDNRPEYFVDVGSGTDGGLCLDGKLDRFFDPGKGTFGVLLQKYVDTDGYIDYIVDLDGDGLASAGEPILFGGPMGTLTKVQRLVDMNGDGKLDVVIDIIDQNDKGTESVPNFFIPNGESASIVICPQDVTGDGVDDWTYDSKGRDCNKAGVKADSYYDPKERTSGFIDGDTNVLLHNLKKYWYVMALFGFALVLFVILVVVTRRR